MPFDYDTNILPNLLINKHLTLYFNRLSHIFLAEKETDLVKKSFYLKNEKLNEHDHR
jgi:hypothetical protein